MTALHAAIGRYPHTEALLADPLFEIADHPVISRAFKPMVRTQAFDVSEMAIATFLMARDAGSDLVLLPVVMAARAQTAALLRRASDDFGPADLRGRKIGARAYSQTTGMWLRGMLHDSFGLKPSDSQWITFEDAHVAAYRDPTWALRAPAGADMLAMLHDGTLDAAIFGNDVPADPNLAPVFPDPAAAGRTFAATHEFDPVNHMIVLRRDIARRPGLAKSLLARFRQGNPYPSGCTALDPAVTLAATYCLDQGLLSRILSADDIWAGLPGEVRET